MHATIRHEAEIQRLGTILGVWAHPDDESYLSAGVMAAATAAGQRVVCVSATVGEAGSERPGPAVASRRTRELARALAAVGVEEHQVLGYPDGGCSGVASTGPAEKLAALFEEIRPDTILTFGPDGMTGHADHRAVSRWTTLAWLVTGRRSRLLYSTTPTGFGARWADVHRRFRVFEPGLPVETPTSSTALQLRLDDELLTRKLTALAAHDSQTAGIRAAMGGAYRDWWSEECFVEGATRLGTWNGMRVAC